MSTNSIQGFQLSDEAIASIVEASPIGMLLVNTDGQVVFVNRKAQDIFGYNKEQFLELKIESLIPQRFHHHHVAQREQFMNQPQSRPMGINRLLYGLGKNGDEIPVEVGLSPLQLQGEKIVLVSVIDVSERFKVAELERHNRSLTLVANQDELTGVLNRRGLADKFQHVVQEAALRDGTVLLMYIDLDGFKTVNDQHGHEIGDQLLVKVALAIKSAVRTNDVVARIGGDEFAVSLGGAEDIPHIGAEIVANKLIGKIRAIREIQGYAITISASIGVVRTRARDNIKLESLVRRADKYMYQAKCAGKGRYVFGDY